MAVDTYDSGSGNWNSGVFAGDALFESWGAGAGGGAGVSDKNAAPGGGGGAYSDEVRTVTASTDYAYSVGAGGASSVDGGDSYWISATDIMAKGGGAGSTLPTNTGGVGGAAASGFGTTKFSGGNGGTGYPGGKSASGGGGGSSASGAGAGTNGANGLDTGLASSGGSSNRFLAPPANFSRLRYDISRSEGSFHPLLLT